MVKVGTPCAHRVNSTLLFCGTDVFGNDLYCDNKAKECAAPITTASARELTDRASVAQRTAQQYLVEKTACTRDKAAVSSRLRLCEAKYVTSVPITQSPGAREAKQKEAKKEENPVILILLIASILINVAIGVAWFTGNCGNGGGFAKFDQKTEMGQGI